MPIVAGDGADERHARFLGPRPRAVASPLEQREHDSVVHQREAGVIADNDAIRRDVERGRQQCPQFRQSLQCTVIAAVRLVGGSVITLSGQPEQIFAQFQLFQRGFAACEVEREALLFERLVVFARPSVEVAQICSTELSEHSHAIRRMKNMQPVTVPARRRIVYRDRPQWARGFSVADPCWRSAVPAPIAAAGRSHPEWPC